MSYETTANAMVTAIFIGKITAKRGLENDVTVVYKRVLYIYIARVCRHFVSGRGPAARTTIWSSEQ